MRRSSPRITGFSNASNIGVVGCALDRTKCAVQIWRMKTRGGCVYILTNGPNGVLYIGVTADLPRRIWEHREGIFDGFTKRYKLKRLVWFEVHDDIRTAIQREKTMKQWSRAWKTAAIERENPDWQDLYPTLV